LTLQIIYVIIFVKIKGAKMQVSNISTLPPELILNISSRLDLKDLVKAGRTCTTWNNLINENDNNVNEIWKKFLDVICAPIKPDKLGNLSLFHMKFLEDLVNPETKTNKSLVIEKINTCLADTHIKSVDDTSGAVRAHLLLSRLGLTNLDKALTYVNTLEKNSSAEKLYTNVGFEYLKNQEIKKAEEIFLQIPEGCSRSLLAMRIFKYYIKVSELDKAFAVMKYSGLLECNSERALVLLIWASALANKPDLGLEALNYTLNESRFLKRLIPHELRLEELKLEDLNKITFHGYFGISARYLYNFFIRKDENAHTTDEHRNEFDVIFYLKNGCLSMAEEVALSLKDPQKRFFGLTRVLGKYNKKGNEKEQARLQDLINAINPQRNPFSEFFQGPTLSS
jgi:F-box domain